MTLPKDPNILYSMINMKLRDEYPDLDDLCASMNINRTELERTLSDAGFRYDSERNAFI